MNDSVYVTTTIPYVNAPPHVGHALEFVQADALARYYRLIGRRTRFQTGTDENAFKNVLAARQQGITPQALVDRNSRLFQETCRALDVEADSFLRTSQERHRLGVVALWRRLRKSDLYAREYRGLYCTGCEDFYLEKDLVHGRCPEHGTPPVTVEEENVFFRLSAYQATLERLLATGRIAVIPETRRNEVLSFLRRGLQDISVSRNASRAGGWGIPVPGDPSQVIYVWIDALINYLSGLGFGTGPEWQTFWNDDTTKIHLIGKNVWKFHAVYWPALLLSADLPLPDRIVVHGFLTSNGRKISKSSGNAADPLEPIASLGSDAVRHYLLRATPPFDDGDFSTERLKAIYNTDLANGLGNLVSRLTNLCEKSGRGAPDLPAVPQPPQSYRDAFETFSLNRAADALWTLITAVNRDIDRAKPWQALKTSDRSSLPEHLARWLAELHRIAYWLQPLLPKAAGRIIAALSARPVRAAPPLFPRVK